jgi:hypothetical protein
MTLKVSRVYAKLNRCRNLRTTNMKGFKSSFVLHKQAKMFLGEIHNDMHLLQNRLRFIFGGIKVLKQLIDLPSSQRAREMTNGVFLYTLFDS